MTENEKVAEIERLAQHEYDLDMEEQARLQAEGDAEVARVSHMPYSGAVIATHQLCGNQMLLSVWHMGAPWENLSYTSKFYMLQLGHKIFLFSLTSVHFCLLMADWRRIPRFLTRHCMGTFLVPVHHEMLIFDFQITVHFICWYKQQCSTLVCW